MTSFAEINTDILNIEAMVKRLGMSGKAYWIQHNFSETYKKQKQKNRKTEKSKIKQKPKSPPPKKIKTRTGETEREPEGRGAGRRAGDSGTDLYWKRPNELSAEGKAGRRDSVKIKHGQRHWKHHFAAASTEPGKGSE